MEYAKKTLKIIFNIIVTVLIIFLSLYVCLNVYNKYIAKNDLLKIGNYYIFQIGSSSMETNLHVGDYIIIENKDDYEVGDVITFKKEDVYVTHRIHRISNNEVITKGDANSAYDESIDKDDILGKMLYKASIISFVTRYRFFIIYAIISIFILEAVLKKYDDDENLEE